ncbi:molybdate ABC transporter substrate-binding protein [Georgenia sp. H159]|uniref:molybdate ABC transporter substrate-binding protein n=1 Tax=Georgenia sp. H159 TaxID=3076115 RepID=UPI002D78FAE0|nr:molybdate ABC transporter substrate-binding protein [Georgenia sp. H159]
MTRRLVGSLLLAVVVGGCGTGGDASADAGELTVFAAASLGEVYEQLAADFVEEHPGTEVSFSFAGSADLVAQVVAGAPADVLATADETTMADAVAAGAVKGNPEVVARNVLTLVTPRGNPAGVTGLDESLDGAALVVCAPQVPCGAATAVLAERLGVTLSPVSEEGSVTDVLGKVTSGQADAGVVYATDAARAGDAVDVVAVPGAEDVVNRYPVAVTTDGDSPGLARAWVEHLGSREGQQVLRVAGFGAP